MLCYNMLYYNIFYEQVRRQPGRELVRAPAGQRHVRRGAAAEPALRAHGGRRPKAPRRGVHEPPERRALPVGRGPGPRRGPGGDVCEPRARRDLRAGGPRGLRAARQGRLRQGHLLCRQGPCI